MLVIISGSSGVGKNTVINEVLKKIPYIKIMPTITTREMREGETEGNPYYFVSEEKFLDMIKNDELYEHQKVHKGYYGTSKAIMADRLKDGKILLKDIDVDGTLNLIKQIDNIVTIYLTVKSKDVLEERLKRRGEKDIELRLKRYEHEMTLIGNYDYVIENDSLQKTVTAICEIIEKHKDNINKATV